MSNSEFPIPDEPKGEGKYFVAVKLNSKRKQYKHVYANPSMPENQKWTSDISCADRFLTYDQGLHNAVKRQLGHSNYKIEKI